MSTTTIPTRGSVLSMTPGTGRVRFEVLEPDRGDPWTLDIVGYGVVVTWVERETGADDLWSVETETQPVVLDSDGRPTPAGFIAQQVDARLSWSVLTPIEGGL